MGHPALLQADSLFTVIRDRCQWFTIRFPSFIVLPEVEIICNLVSSPEPYGVNRDGGGFSALIPANLVHFDKPLHVRI
jgi:hypothetical protein